MPGIKILDAELKCLTCGQKTKLAHLRCVRNLRNKAVEEALNKERKEFLDAWRSLHDYTFINVTDANKVIYLRDNIEDEIEKWEKRLKK